MNEQDGILYKDALERYTTSHLLHFIVSLLTGAAGSLYGCLSLFQIVMLVLKYEMHSAGENLIANHHCQVWWFF